MMPAPRFVEFRCVQCRRNSSKPWSGLGPMPTKCADCRRKNTNACNRRNAARRKAGLPRRGPTTISLRCTGCQTFWSWTSRTGKGIRPARCPSCAKSRRLKKDAASWARRKAERETKEAMTLAAARSLGEAPKNYPGYVASAKCVHCWRSVATMRPGRRTCCSSCLVKGLR